MEGTDWKGITLKFIEDNLDDKARVKFSKMEYDKFLRVVKYMEITNYSEEKLKEGHRDFYNWFNEYDRRRGTNLLEIFPELEDFYKSIKDQLND